MKCLIVYDSTYGHTERISQAMAEAISCRMQRAGELDPSELSGYDQLIIGSPTHGGWFTEDVKCLLDKTPSLAGIKLAVFDTRTRKSLFGFAAPRLARRVEKHGGKLVVAPEGFVVLGMKGPLEAGELERAARWAKRIAG